jgi:hypothetical protein
MNLHAEAVVAMGDAEQLRNRTRDASSEICAALMGRSAWVQNQITPGTSTQAAPTPQFCTITERKRLFAGRESARSLIKINQL